MGRGDHPNSRKALEENRAKTQFCGETAVEAQKKSAAVQRANGMLSADLKQQLDDDTIERLNAKLIAMAKAGNLKAYEIIRDGIGEKPIDKQQHIIDATNEAYADYVRQKEDSGRSDI